MSASRPTTAAGGRNSPLPCRASASVASRLGRFSLHERRASQQMGRMGEDRAGAAARRGTRWRADALTATTCRRRRMEPYLWLWLITTPLLLAAVDLLATGRSRR